MVVILTKVVNKDVNYSRKILVTGLGPGRASVDGYIAVLKIQMEICKDGRRV